jgi:pimeloyl-ACP methyl ester carboxylesterase
VLANALQIDSFGVIGISAGGTYAAACAALLPERLSGVAIFACRAISEYNWAERPGARDEWTPEERAEFDLAQQDPSAAADLAAEHAADFFGQLEQQPEIITQGLEEADGDRWFFDDATRKRDLEATIRDWGRQGLDGVKWEFIDVFLPWGFRLADIQIPVTIWFGGQDPRIKHLEFQAQIIPNSSTTVWPEKRSPRLRHTLGRNPRCGRVTES